LSNEKIGTYILSVVKTGAQKYDYTWVLGDKGGPVNIVFTDADADTLGTHRMVYMDNSQAIARQQINNHTFFFNTDGNS
jgi:hypothetical protein